MNPIDKLYQTVASALGMSREEFDAVISPRQKPDDSITPHGGEATNQE